MGILGTGPTQLLQDLVHRSQHLPWERTDLKGRSLAPVPKLAVLLWLSHWVSVLPFMEE